MKILFYISEEDIQNEAYFRIGRKLSEDEIGIIEDRLSWGIGESLNIIYSTIFTEDIPK